MRSYARARVASSSTDSTPLREVVTATRWADHELRDRLTQAPVFSLPKVDEHHLDEMCAQYTAITGDPVLVTEHRKGKRNLIAACYRVHGGDFLPLVRELFARSGSATNLLGTIRMMPPRSSASSGDAKTGHVNGHASTADDDTIGWITPQAAQAWGGPMPEPEERLGPRNRASATVPATGFEGLAVIAAAEVERPANHKPEPRKLAGVSALERPTSSKLPLAPDKSGSSTSVRCDDYSAHRSYHRWVKVGWVCDACAAIEQPR